MFDINHKKRDNIVTSCMYIVWIEIVNFQFFMSKIKWIFYTFCSEINS